MAGKWSTLDWRRRLETFGLDDGPVVAKGPHGEVDAVCNLGELTDKGRQTTHSLGTRLRHLYVDQLRFMPEVIQDADMIYLRATPIPRALESLQQTFWGMYPSHARAASFPPITIITRAPADETLFPNEGNCRRFAQLSRAFAQRTADRWNNTDDMEYLNKKVGKWMPESSKRVAIDSHPRLSGIMDTINSTLAHGPETRLPKEFYDDKLRAIIEKIEVEEWFDGFKESKEYREVGIGGLVGDIVERMVGSVEQDNYVGGLLEVGDSTGSKVQGRGGEQKIKMALSGCHDTTLAAVLSSLGAFENEKWPPYTSHIAVELFKKSDLQTESSSGRSKEQEASSPLAGSSIKKRTGWFSRILGDKVEAAKESGSASDAMTRKKTPELSEAQKARLQGYFVRIRYNDRPMTVPGCRPAGKHLDGDETFCTLVSFDSHDSCMAWLTSL